MANIFIFKLTGAKGEDKLTNGNYCMQFEKKVIAVDIRMSGGCVICPSSNKIDSDKRYKWENDCKVPIAPLPDWILHNILDTCASKKTNASSISEDIEVGGETDVDEDGAF